MLRWIVVYLIFGSILYSSESKEKLITTSLPFFAWGFSLDGFPISESHLILLQQETKIAAQLIQFYLQWPSSPENFTEITSSLEAISRAGALPVITWEPMISSPQEEAIPYEKILSGYYDAYLIKTAEEIKRWNKPIIIRLAQEMNLKRYHWGTSQEHYGPKSPEIYKQIYKYIVDLFNRKNVHNVLWAFCPNVDSDPKEPWNQIKNYYPGDQYVDLLGMDGYNWAISKEEAQVKQSSWIKPLISFEELFQEVYQQLKAIAPDKPIIIFETASTNRKDKQKSEWIKQALQTAKKWKLAGIIWFQVNKEEDWRIQQDEDYSYVPFIKSATTPYIDFK